MFAKKGSGLGLILSTLMQPAFESKEEEEIEFLPQLPREQQAASYLSSMGDQTGITSQTPFITSASFRAASNAGVRMCAAVVATTEKLRLHTVQQAHHLSWDQGSTHSTSPETNDAAPALRHV
jgi:hypothetical protein